MKPKHKAKDEKHKYSQEEFEKLQDKCALLEHKVDELTAALTWYEEQFRLSKHKQFGSSREKTDNKQGRLFDEAELVSDAKAKEPVLEETITYKRSKKKSKKDRLPEELPVERVEYRIAEEDRDCPQCSSTLHEMSEEVRKELIVIPAQVKVKEHVRYVYTCRSCEKDDIKTPVITAPMPAPAIPGSFASSSLISFIMNRKYNEAIPLYRQEQQFKNYGIDLSRQSMANWMIQSSEKWLKHFCEHMHSLLLDLDILHADETTLQVLQEEDRKASSKSYMWLYASGKTDKPIFLYDYRTTRASKHPQNMLKGFKGYLHVDAYGGYKKIPDVKIVGCWSHARRNFVEALRAMPEKGASLSSVVEEGLKFCNQLFSIERQLADETPDRRYLLRWEKSRPVLDDFLTWLKKKQKQTLPKSALGKAILYCLNHWDNLENYMLDGRLEISNNRAERAIKPFVIGRKNFLFANTPKGATARSVLEIALEIRENRQNIF